MCIIYFKRLDSPTPDFVKLASELDYLIYQRHTETHTVCQQYNKPESLKHILIAYDSQTDIPIACGAIREYTTNVMEIKRMYVSENQRGKGVAKRIIGELEDWATELGAEKCILETGTKLIEAIRLYEKCGYKKISNYGQYSNMSSSICYKKDIKLISLS